MSLKFELVGIEKSKKTPNTQRQKSYDEKKIKISKKYRGQQITNQRKFLNQIKEIQNNLKISINAEINLRETRAIAVIQQNPKYFYKFVKHNSAIRVGIGPPG